MTFSMVKINYPLWNLFCRLFVEAACGVLVFIAVIPLAVPLCRKKTKQWTYSQNTALKRHARSMKGKHRSTVSCYDLNLNSLAITKANKDPGLGGEIDLEYLLKPDAVHVVFMIGDEGGETKRRRDKKKGTER